MILKACIFDVKRFNVSKGGRSARGYELAKGL